MNERRRTLTIALIAIGLTAIASPAFAGPFGSTNPFGGDPFVVLTGRLDVPEGTVTSDAIIFNGDASVAGDVSGNVIAFNGDVAVTGSVDGDVVAVNGRVTLGPRARVGGDVVSRDLPVIAGSATVGGRIRRSSRFDVNAGQFAAIGRFLWWIATSRPSPPPASCSCCSRPERQTQAASTAARRLGASIGVRLPDADRGAHRCGHRHGAPRRDPDRTRCLLASAPVLARLHRRRVRARPAARRRPRHPDVGVPGGVRHPARPRTHPVRRRPRSGSAPPSGGSAPSPHRSARGGRPRSRPRSQPPPRRWRAAGPPLPSSG